MAQLERELRLAGEEKVHLYKINCQLEQELSSVNKDQTEQHRRNRVTREELEAEMKTLKEKFALLSPCRDEHQTNCARLQRITKSLCLATLLASSLPPWQLLLQSLILSVLKYIGRALAPVSLWPRNRGLKTLRCTNMMPLRFLLTVFRMPV